MTIQSESIWQNYDLDTLQQGLEQLFPEYQISVNQLLEEFLQGNIRDSGFRFIENCIRGIGGYASSLKNILVWILILGIASSLITHFVSTFDKNQIADLSFYLMYLLFTAVLLHCFKEAILVAGEVLDNIVLFMQLMIPTYMLAVGVAGGIGTATVSYQIMLGIIYGAENILKGGVLPFVRAYIMLILMNGVWVEEKLKLLIQLLEKCIQTILKCAVGAVTGISIFQSLLMPAMHSVKNSVLQKVISAIPGIGNAAEGVMELMMGSAVIIRNSIGVMCMVILLGICAAPLLYIFLLSWVLRIAAAILGLISDKRLTECTNQFSEASMLLFKTAATAVALFFISISVVAITSGSGR